MTAIEALADLVKTFPTDDDMRNAGWHSWEIAKACRAYDAARAALAEPAAEPVAWIDPADFKTLEDDGWCVVHASQCDPGADHAADTPLYTHPAPAAAPEPTVEQSISALVDALVRSKGWLHAYADSIIRDAIDRAPQRSRGPAPWDAIAGIPKGRLDNFNRAKADFKAVGGCKGCGSLILAVHAGNCPQRYDNPY